MVVRRLSTVGLWAAAAILGAFQAQAALLVPGPEKRQVMLVMEPTESASHFKLGAPDRLVIDIKGATLPLQLHPEAKTRLEGRGLRQSMDKESKRLVLDLFPGDQPKIIESNDGKRLEILLPKVEGYAVPKGKGGLSFSTTGFGWELVVKGAGQIVPTFETRFDPPQLLVHLPQYKLKEQSLKVPSGPVQSVSIKQKKDGTLVHLNLKSFLPYNWVPGQDGRLVLQRPALAGKTIVVDAGHGGHDPGALALNGADSEKQLVLDVSLRVKDLLEKSGATVVMSRVDDSFLSLQERAQVANKSKANLFVSIHANSLPWNPNAKGTETFFFNEGGKRLAQAIQPQLIQSTGQTDRGVKQARFFVIRFAQMPAVLVETGFVTNDGDLARLKSSVHQYNFAAAVVNGIEVFYGGKPFQAIRGKGAAPPLAPAIVVKPSTPPISKEEAKLAMQLTKAELSESLDWEAF